MAETDQVGKQKAKRRTRRHAARRGQKSSLTPADVVAHFAACGRCSFFLSDYRFNQNPAQFATAVAESDAEWLNLPWDEDLRELIYRSYGYRFDIDAIFLDAICPECHRQFTYIASASPDEPAIFCIMI